jgi:hypothetical protein
MVGLVAGGRTLRWALLAPTPAERQLVPATGR